MIAAYFWGCALGSCLLCWWGGCSIVVGSDVICFDLVFCWLWFIGAVDLLLIVLVFLTFDFVFCVVCYYDGVWVLLVIIVGLWLDIGYFLWLVDLVVWLRVDGWQDSVVWVFPGLLFVFELYDFGCVC